MEWLQHIWSDVAKVIRPSTGCVVFELKGMREVLPQGFNTYKS